MTIVCGTDFSQAARGAMSIAAGLARRLHQELVLVHAIAPQAFDPVTFDLEPVRSALAEALEREAAELRRKGVDVAVRAITGWPEEEIIHIARETEATLIVAGAFGRHRGPHWLIGSVAERLAQATPVPLLLVRDPGPLQSWIDGADRLHVLAPVDFTPVSDSALQWLETLRSVGPFDVTLEHVVNPVMTAERLNLTGPISHTRLHPAVDVLVDRELCERSSEIRTGGSVFSDVKVSMDRIGSVIARAATEHRCNLIVIGGHQRTLGAALIHGRVTRDVIHESGCSVVCIPFHEAPRESSTLRHSDRELAVTRTQIHFRDQGEAR